MHDVNGMNGSTRITVRIAITNVCVSVCSQPDSFTVQITENEYVVYGTKLLIRYNSHIGIFSYPEIKPVNVVFDETVIEFKGNY